MAQPTTTQAQNPLFGRKYKITVSIPASDGSAGQTVITIADSSFEPESLRVVFDIYTPRLSAAFWYADIDIYNLDQTTTSQIVSANLGSITQGMTCSISAGYQNGNFDLVWAGPVFQPLWSRENVIDFKLTLHCILGLFPMKRAPISATYGPGTSQLYILQDIIKKSFAATNDPVMKENYITPSLSQKTLPRGKTVFGSPSKYFDQISQDNNVQWFLSQNGLNVGGPGETGNATELTYTPETGLIGTPRQTQQGVDFTVLLDPRVRASQPPMKAKIDLTSIQLQKRQIGELPGFLDANGSYFVAAVRHRGDTRGTDWYTDVTGYTSINDALAWSLNYNHIGS